MDELDQPTTTHATIRAVLQGGPVDLPDAVRFRQEALEGPYLKVPYRAGYEHFERDPDPGQAGSPAIYRWVARTMIAE